MPAVSDITKFEKVAHTNANILRCIGQSRIQGSCILPMIVFERRPCFSDLMCQMTGSTSIFLLISSRLPNLLQLYLCPRLQKITLPILVLPPHQACLTFPCLAKLAHTTLSHLLPVVTRLQCRSHDLRHTSSHRWVRAR